MKPLLQTAVMACCLAADTWADEIEELTKKYNASVTIVMHRGIGFHGYARLTDESKVWVSNGKRKTRIVDASSKQEIKKLIADQMRPGVIEEKSQLGMK